MDKRRWRDSFRFSLSIQMIGMVLVISLAGMLLVRTWAGVIATSRRTEALNKGVLLCRSAAELYAPGGDLGEAVRGLGGEAEPEAAQARLCFDREMKLTGEPGFLVLELRELPEQTQGIRQCQLTVEQDQKELYTLTVSAFVPEGG